MARWTDVTIHRPGFVPSRAHAPVARPRRRYGRGKPARGPDSKLLERARALLQRAPLIDTHNDLPYALLEKTGGDLTRIDLGKRQPELPADVPRLREGRVGGQYWAVYVDSDTALTRSALHQALRVFDVALRAIESRPHLPGALRRAAPPRLEDLLKLAGRNHRRAMREMEKVAAELQRTTPPAVVEGPRNP